MIDNIGSTILPPSLGTSDAGAMPAPGIAFEQVLEKATAMNQQSQVKTVREESRKLVAEAFIAPLLAKIREDNKAAAPFGPTSAEKRFGPMFDRAIADAMTRPDRFPMVEAVERSILQRMNGAAGGQR